MSFNLNPMNNINQQPVIQQSQKSKDGGAGNTGYFQQGKKKKNEDEDLDAFDKSIFDETKDSEDFMSDEEPLGKKIFDKIKKLFGGK